MIVTPIKTALVYPNDDLFELLEKSLPAVKEKDVVVITSKIVGLCEGRVVPIPDGATHEYKEELVRQEADLYIENFSEQYRFLVTVKDSILAVNAGIDESNTGGYYVFWPKDLQESVNQIWIWLKEKYHLKEVGVVMTDSKTFPMKWGVVGTCLAHCGFLSLTDKRGAKDLFDRELKMTQMNISEGIAVATVLETGEADECTPLAIVRDVSHIIFQDHVPTKEELDILKMSMNDDVYAPLLQHAAWKKGKHGT